MMVRKAMIRDGGPIRFALAGARLDMLVKAARNSGAPKVSIRPRWSPRHNAWVVAWKSWHKSTGY